MSVRRVCNCKARTADVDNERWGLCDRKYSSHAYPHRFQKIKHLLTAHSQEPFEATRASRQAAALVALLAQRASVRPLHAHTAPPSHTEYIESAPW